MAYYATYMPDETGAFQKVVYNCGVGFCLPFYGETAPPGTLACDGSEISREAYSKLFEVLGTKAGVGDGVSTFNLPDFRGKWLMGADTERAAGEEVAEGLPNVTGDIYVMDVSKNGTAQFHGTGGAFLMSPWTPPSEYPNLARPQAEVCDADGVQWKDISFSAQRFNTIYGASAHVTPASVALLWCIIYE